MSESKTFKVQVHPMIESIIIELDGELTSDNLLDEYTTVAAKRYGCKEEVLRDTLKQAIPFTPVYPAPDGALFIYCGKKLTSHT